VFQQVNLIAADVLATVAFYRRLGLPVTAQPGDQHVEIACASGVTIEWDGAESVRLWNSGWRNGGRGASSNVVLGFALPSREAVDQTYADLTSAGHPGQQPPHDAFWGARYAVVEDPDGTSVGLMSPIDDSRKVWPPIPPPEAGAR
jgi:catechol 2,3-dioxygenase-like lactoylglutathione lyase family enzyme